VGDLLKGKVAIVTGAGRGIGREEALALAREGARVVVNDIGVSAEGAGSATTPAEEVVAEIRKIGGEAVTSFESVADFAGARRIVETALDSFGRLDILVNNAAIFIMKLIIEHTEEDWDRMVAVHLKGTFNMCRHAAPVMIKQGYGRIINTSSNQWRTPEGRVSYAAAKGGIVSFTYALAWELRNDGITVNAIAPFAATRAMESARVYDQHTADLGLERQDRGVYSRPGPEFVPPMVVYLASDLAPHVTGRIFRTGAGKVAIYNHPEELRGVYKDYKKNGPWTIEELKDVLPNTVLSSDTRAPHIP